MALNCENTIISWVLSFSVHVLLKDAVARNTKYMTLTEPLRSSIFYTKSIYS